MEDLSPRQQEILDFILAVVDQRGVVPSYREIGSALGIGSTNGVSDHIKALIRKGYLEKVNGPGAPRSLRTTTAAKGFHAEDGTVTVPIVGRVAAGVPLLAEENYEGSVRLDRSMLPPGGDVFALTVTGESMIEDGIHDGDTLFVRQQRSIRDGEIGVVLVGDEATVKRVYRERDGRMRLQPANSAMKPIFVDERSPEVSVVGVVVGVFRRV
jgi:repressor LexA